MGPGGGMGLMWLWWLLILLGGAAIVVGLVRAGLPRSGGSGGGTEASASTARQILDERFARGEIDEEEYRTRRRVLDA